MNICLENALLAPNSSNLQPWGFYLVQNPEKKEALIKACLDQVAAKTASEMVVVIARTSTWKEHAAEMLFIPPAYQVYDTIGFINRKNKMLVGTALTLYRKGHDNGVTWHELE